MCSLERERRFPGELAFLYSMDTDGSTALENSDSGLFQGSRQLTIAGSCSDTHLGQKRLPELHSWPGRKDLPLLSPWHGGAGTCHGAAHEELLSALLHATATLVSAGSDAWRGKMVWNKIPNVVNSHRLIQWNRSLLQGVSERKTLGRECCLCDK